MITLRLGKSGKTGIGCKKADGKKTYKPLRRSPLKRVGKLRTRSKKRIREDGVLSLSKRLVAQEYREVTGQEIPALMKLDLDHIHGRHGDFVLGNMFDPRNLQLLTRAQHREKTDSKIPGGQRFDYRSKEIQARLIRTGEEIEKRLGPVWDLKDLKRAIESLIWSE